jgi:hypothetical protein
VPVLNAQVSAFRFWRLGDMAYLYRQLDAMYLEARDAERVGQGRPSSHPDSRPASAGCLGSS